MIDPRGAGSNGARLEAQSVGKVTLAQAEGGSKVLAVIGASLVAVSGEGGGTSSQHAAIGDQGGNNKARNSHGSNDALVECLLVSNLALGVRGLVGRVSEERSLWLALGGLLAAEVRVVKLSIDLEKQCYLGQRLSRTSTKSCSTVAPSRSRPSDSPCEPARSPVCTTKTPPA